MEEFDPIAYINMPRWQHSRLGLGRITRLLELLGRPQDALRFVHVAGTNGKGSTCSYLASVLTCAGYKAGLFTSPYIETFEERIRVDGVNISHEDLTAATCAVRACAEAVEAEMGEHPTEFELMCAVALQHFSAVGCDVVVLEVGLGGRLDSTNVIDAPEVCVISRIGYDHTAILGDTLPAIAQEKAGIIKTGAAVVSWPQEPEAMRVVERVARERGCMLSTPDFTALEVAPLDLREASTSGMRAFFYRGRRYQTQLLGSYQPANAALAIEAVRALRARGWNIADEALAQGIAQARWPGRFEVVGTCPLTIVDGGHNPQGAVALRDSLYDALGGAQHAQGAVTFVMGVLADKDYRAMVEAVVPLARAFVTFEPPNPRALSADGLAAAIASAAPDAPVEAACDAASAMRRAYELAGDAGVVVAFGSLYSIADVKAALRW